MRFIATVQIAMEVEDIDEAKDVSLTLEDLGGFVNHTSCDEAWITDIRAVSPNEDPILEMAGLRSGKSFGDVCRRCRHLRGYHADGTCSEVDDCQCVSFQEAEEP